MRLLHIRCRGESKFIRLSWQSQILYNTSASLMRQLARIVWIFYRRRVGVRPTLTQSVRGWSIGVSTINCRPGNRRLCCHERSNRYIDIFKSEFVGAVCGKSSSWIPVPMWITNPEVPSYESLLSWLEFSCRTLEWGHVTFGRIISGIWRVLGRETPNNALMVY